jgi:hypothetical protein
LHVGGDSNFYAYALGNPVNRIDSNGLWSPLAHDTFIEHALGRIAPNDVLAIQLGSRYLDETTQGTRFAHMHSLLRPGQDPSELIKERDKFIKDKLRQARCYAKEGDRARALYALGEALHPLMDSISPAHIGPREWNPLNPFRLWGHSPFEGIGMETAADILESDYQTMDSMIFDAYLSVFK